MLVGYKIKKPLKACFQRFRGPGESRTPNLLIRSQMLYPIKLRVQVSILDCKYKL